MRECCEVLSESTSAVYYADRDGPNNEKWIKATVKGCIGGVMYLIEKENGRCVRAHANQLRERQIEKFEEDTEMHGLFCRMLLASSVQ